MSNDSVGVSVSSNTLDLTSGNSNSNNNNTTTAYTPNGTVIEFELLHNDLKVLNSARAETLIPVMLVLGLYMIVGTVGNSLVCYVMGCKLKTNTQNVLIVYLAVFDLINCFISIPVEINELRHSYCVRSVTVCKITRTVTHFANTSSVLTLLLIAVDRYRKICLPMKRQLNVHHVKRFLAIIVLAAIVVTSPALLIYGSRTIKTGIPGVLGHDCSHSDTLEGSPYHTVYAATLLISLTCLSMSIVMMYGSVLSAARSHRRYRIASGSNPNHFTCSSVRIKYSNSKSKYILPNNKIETAKKANGIVVVVIDHNMKKLLCDSKGNQNISTMSCNRDLLSLGKRYSSPVGFDSSEALNNYSGPSSNDQLSTTTAKNGIENLENCNNGERSKHVGNKNGKGMASKGSCQSFHGNDENETSNNLKQNVISTIEGSDNIIATTADKKSISLNPNDGGNEDTPIPIRAASQLKPIDNDEELPAKVKITRKISKSKLDHKTSLIAFLVTLLFILSFVPSLSLQICRQVVKGFDYNLNGTALIFHDIFIRSYYINSIGNPIIYGLINNRFRREIRLLLSKLTRRTNNSKSIEAHYH